MMPRAVIVMPSLPAGGAERVATILGNEWCKRPATQVTLVLLFDDQIFFSLDARIRIIRLGMVPQAARLKWIWQIISTLPRLRQIIVKERPQFVLSMIHKYNLYCLLSTWRTGVPIIVSERDNVDETPVMLRLLRYLFYGYAAGAVAQTDAARTLLLRETKLRHVTVLPNPVELDSSSTIDGREQIIISVGRLVQSKGHADLLNAFASLHRKDWQLVICGDGPSGEDLRRLAERLGIASQVLFLGTVSGVREWLRRAQIFALPSYTEGFPNALAEAMATGLAVVSYDCPTGPREMIRDGQDGLLVPVGDKDFLASSLLTLMEDRVRADELGAAAYCAARRFDSTAVASAYFDFCSHSASLMQR